MQDGQGIEDEAACEDCGTSFPLDSQPADMYRCDECFDFAIICQTCTVKRHQSLPFHRFEVRIKSFISATSKLNDELALGRPFLEQIVSLFTSTAHPPSPPRKALPAASEKRNRDRYAH